MPNELQGSWELTSQFPKLCQPLTVLGTKMYLKATSSNPMVEKCISREEIERSV